MFKKNIFKILILCMALAQLPLGSFGRRQCRFPTNYTLRQPSADDKKLPVVLQLEKSIVDAEANWNYLIMLKAKNIYDKVIKELQTMNNTESALEHLQTKILAFETCLEPCKTLLEQYQSNFYSEITSYYPQKLAEYENDEIKTIVKVMKKYNVHDYKSLFQPEIADVVKTFEEKFQELKEPIKRENEELSYKLNNWFEKVYNTKNDLFDKAGAIGGLIKKKFFLVNARNNYYTL